jgi:molecular chaperone HtpG
MAGKKVEITTKSAQKDEPAYIWTSTGQGSFQITPAPGDIKRGTTIKVFLREDAEKFSQKATVQSAIEKYSNFVPFPIYLEGEKANKISAIWREPKSSVKEKDYKEFFKFIARQNDDPLTWYHFKADVPLQFNVLLFIPQTNFELMGLSRKDSGINLFVKRVMIDPQAKEILPSYLRFVEGVIESDDLPLNISRETLQENPYMIKIKNTVVSKFLSYLKDFSQKKPDQYKQFWDQFGRILKEGYTDYSNKDKIADLYLFNSSKCKDKDELIDLKTYVERLVKDQDEIYFLSGPSRQDLDNNPTLEMFKKNNIEVLYCYDPVDEFVLPGLFEYKKKKIVSADQAELSKIEKLSTQKEKKKEVSSAKRQDLEKLTRRMKNILGDKVEDVILSDRLIDSPALLAGTDMHMSKQMEKIMQMVNREVKPIPKKMEINKNHPLINKMLTIYKTDPKDALLTKLVHNLYTSVLLLDGNITDTHEMVDNLQNLLKETANLYTKQEGKK